MAGSPDWKVYNEEREYRAACKSVEEAAVLVSFLGDGATIRFNHGMVVWTEGTDGQASESYDHVAEVAYGRIDARKAALRAKREAAGYLSVQVREGDEWVRTRPAKLSSGASSAAAEGALAVVGVFAPRGADTLVWYPDGSGEIRDQAGEPIVRLGLR